MSAATTEHIHVARQPILDARGEIYGYELLYRDVAEGAACSATPGNATARVISEVVAGPMFETVSDGRRAFLNVSTDVLVSDVISLVDPERVVLEILESVEVTAAVIAACESLAQRGYAVALDAFVAGSAAEALLPHARFAKVDVLATPAADLRALVPRLLGAGLSVIAEKVETPAALAAAREAGCSLFQGYHFCRPETFTARAMAPNQILQMQLLAALLQPAVSLVTVEELLKGDASLSYRVLRCVNSAGFGLRREVRSIREALLLLGLNQVRTWASLWTLAALNRGPTELITMTLVRARACEAIGAVLGRGDHGYFLLGLCSLLDVLLGRPMAEVTSELPVTDEIRAALLGDANGARNVLDAVALYERGQWATAAQLAGDAGLGEGTLASAYLDALTWSRTLAQVSNAAGAAASRPGR